jgi:hypothetical protein
MPIHVRSDERAGRLRPAGGHTGAAAGFVRRSLTGGGTDGNERLTTLTGLVLIVLLAVLGVTIVRIRQLLWLHLFLGLLLTTLAVFAVHVLGHAPEILRYLRTTGTARREMMALPTAPNR